ncbi:TraC family protein [Rhizobium lusitanum]|uniref:TraC family protein n=1 Tax=Rhizobium lusitanum TaxID=293958 RepID=UPI00195E6092|nr:TraC family protein [Rhizobium lusitanum]MBM7046574.1 TraC family protein [Rhizobium lusitanum]
MPKKSFISDIDAQIEKLRDRKKLLIVKSAERFARAATKSGLAELDISDEELDAIFEDFSRRFLPELKNLNQPSSQTPRSQTPASGAAGEAPKNG